MSRKSNTKKPSGVKKINKKKNGLEKQQHIKNSSHSKVGNVPRNADVDAASLELISGVSVTTPEVIDGKSVKSTQPEIQQTNSQHANPSIIIERYDSKNEKTVVERYDGKKVTSASKAVAEAGGRRQNEATQKTLMKTKSSKSKNYTLATGKQLEPNTTVIQLRGSDISMTHVYTRPKWQSAKKITSRATNKETRNETTTPDSCSLKPVYKMMNSGSTAGLLHEMTLKKSKLLTRLPDSVKEEKIREFQRYMKINQGEDKSRMQSASDHQGLFGPAGLRGVRATCSVSKLNVEPMSTRHLKTPKDNHATYVHVSTRFNSNNEAGHSVDTLVKSKPSLCKRHQLHGSKKITGGSKTRSEILTSKTIKSRRDMNQAKSLNIRKGEMWARVLEQSKKVPKLKESNRQLCLPKLSKVRERAA